MPSQLSVKVEALYYHADPGAEQYGYVTGIETLDSYLSPATLSVHIAPWRLSVLLSLLIMKAKQSFSPDSGRVVDL